MIIVSVIWGGLGVLAQGCCNEANLPAAQRALYSQDTRQQTKALYELSRCGEKAESAVQRITALMYAKNVGVASAAAYALRKIDSKQSREALRRAEAAREHKRR